MILRTIHVFPLGNFSQYDTAYWLGFSLIVANLVAVVAMHLYSLKKTLKTVSKSASCTIKLVRFCLYIKRSWGSNT